MEKTGPVPRNVRDEIWKEFRSYLMNSSIKEILNIEKDQNKENYNAKVLLMTAKKYGKLK